MKRFLKISFLFISLFLSTTHAQWQFINSPLATPDIRFVAQHPDGYIIAVSSLNEVFKSDISHTYWNRITTLNKTISSFAVGLDGVFYAGVIGGYLYSNDIGVTWQEKQLFISSNDYITDIEFNPGGFIFILTSSNSTSLPRILRSNDNGNTWINSDNGLPNSIYTIPDIEKDTSANLFVFIDGIPSPLYKSTDNGYSWNLIPNNIDGQTKDFIIDSNNNIYAVVYEYSPYIHKIMKSSDLGNNWSEIYLGPVVKLYVDFNNYLFGTIDYSDRLVSPDTGFIHFNLIYSTNGGDNWTGAGIAALRANDILLIYDSLFMATTNGLRKSFSLDNDWTSCFSYSDKYVSVNDIIKLSNNDLSLIGTNNGIFKSENNFINWGSIHPLSETKLLKKDSIGHIYAVSKFLYYSTDEGINWSIPYNLVSFSPVNIQNVFINDSNYIFIIEGYQGLGLFARKSTDFGDTWNLMWIINYACTASNTSYSFVEDKVGTLFISYHLDVHCNPTPQFTHSYVKKKEIGSDWSIVLDDIIAYNIYSLDSFMYFATNEGIYKSTNDGDTLIQMNNGFADLNVTQLILKSEVFLALTGDGVYKSLDNGNSWIRLDHTGLNAAINKLYYDENKNLYACTQNGIYLFNGELTSLNEDGVSLNPIEFSLSQNYPNPFNPTTKISYQLPIESKVLLKVYDVLGSEVATIINEYQDAGFKELDFDASSLSSGIYIYKIIAGDFVSSKKMIVLK